MTGRTAGRSLAPAACAASAILLAACAPAPVVPSPRAAAYAPPPPVSPFPLPALTDDGLRFPDDPIAPEPLPRAVSGWIEDREPDEPWKPWPEGARTGPGGEAFPDAAALLAGLAVGSEERDGALTFSGTESETAGRALAALDGALGRRYRVEVRAVRTWPGRPAPSADAVLAESSARVLLRFDQTMRDGALAAAAPRLETTFPADVDLEHVTARPEALRFGIGAALQVSPARVDGRRALLRMAFHATRLLGERRIAGDEVERVAPLLATMSFGGEVPAADGVAAAVVADSGDPETSFVLAWRVTLDREPAGPAASAALSLHADRRLVQGVTPPGPGRVALPPEDVDLDGLGDFVPPVAVPADLRAALVEPGIYVATGGEDAFRRWAEEVEAARSATLAPATFRLGRTSFPFVPARGAVLVQGRLVPVAGEPDLSIAQESCSVAARTWWIFGGRSLRIAPERGGAVATIQSSDTPQVVPGDAAIPRYDAEGVRTSHDAADAVRLRVSSSRVALRSGGPAEGGASMEEAAW